MLLRIVLTAAALACAAAAPARAEPVSIAVPYGDIDLTKEAGRKTLDARLERAARKLCVWTGSARDLARYQAQRECLAAARRSWGPQVALALEAANARRVAVLADKLYLAVRF